MRAVVYGLAGAVLWMASTSAPAAAQQRDWWGWALEELREVQEYREYRDDRGYQDGREYRDDRRYRDDREYRDRWEDRGRRDPRRAHPRRTRGRDAGPPFCRNGRGHPVHGWAWCLEKGFAPAAPPPVIWRRHHWDAPHFRPLRRHGLDAFLRGPELRIVLGDLAYGNLTRHRHRLGAREPLVGRWYRPARRTLVLQVRSGPFPVAELSDLDGDGHVDVVLLADR